jgi:hypothetical protein
MSRAPDLWCGPELSCCEKERVGVKQGGEGFSGMEPGDKSRGGEFEGFRSNRLSPFLRSSTIVRMPLFSGLKAFWGPRKTKKKISLTSKTRSRKFSKCGR